MNKNIAVYNKHNKKMNLLNNDKKENSGWCPPGRTPKIMNGVCYCDYSQYSVKPRCLLKEPDCFVKNLDNGYTYSGQNTGAYITHGKNRIES